MKILFVFLLCFLCVSVPGAADEQRYDGTTHDDWQVMPHPNRPAEGAAISCDAGVVVLAYDRAHAPAFAHLATVRDFERLHLRLRSHLAIELTVWIKDEDKADYSRTVSLPADTWVDLVLEPDQFVLGKEAPPDHGPLRPDRVSIGYALLDTHAFFPARPVTGANRIEVDEVRIRIRPPGNGGGAGSTPQPAGQAHTWTRTPEEPVIAAGFEVSPGGPLCEIASDPTVLRDSAEQRWHAWFTIWWRESGTPQCAIKHAESSDGIEWEVDTGFALQATDDAAAWDSGWVQMPCVTLDPTAADDRRFALYYTGTDRAQAAGTGFRHQAIGVAFSGRGRRFQRLPAAESRHDQEGLLLRPADLFPPELGAADGSVAAPQVLRIDDRRLLWFSGVALNASGKAVSAGIGHAHSLDGLTWTPASRFPLRGLEPVDGLPPQRPAVVRDETRRVFEMWTSRDAINPAKIALPLTDGYWLATSNDGIEWRTEPGAADFVGQKSLPRETLGLSPGPTVLRMGDELLLYYAAVCVRKDGRGVPAGSVSILRAVGK